VKPGEGASAARRVPSHIPSLDGLRAASFLLVFAAHAGLKDIIPGAFGVTVFFFLSGYLITTLMRGEVSRTGRVSLTSFYLRRALRILPPFYIVLVAATLLAGLGFVAGALQPKATGSQPTAGRASPWARVCTGRSPWRNTSTCSSQRSSSC
jgi:peptidoglycan/LPS O-acetylase OafA/YrhL